MFGEIRIRITDQPIDWATHLEEHLGQSSQTHGAEILFLGKVRNHNLGKTVLAVSYDAHAPLTEKVLREICQEAQTKWGHDLNFTVIHRVGRLEVQDLSVVIQVSSPHRDESYQASRYVIEQLKHRAPIWKKEHYLNGESEWLQGHALCGKGSEEANHF